MNLENLTIEKARKLLDSKEVTVRALADYYLGNIEKRNGELNAVVGLFTNIDKQVEIAQSMIDAGKAKALTGIPYLLKDNILYEGQIAGAASKMLQNYTATYDSHVVEMLKDQGAIALGRANMDEFAMGSSTEFSYYGPTKNPHDTSRVPGGTSGGSAAAVAADMALFTLGSDTAGSIRQPAGFCGTVGYKPTYGVVSRHGLMAMGSSLDTIGPLTRTVADTGIVHDVLSSYDPMDATNAPYDDRKKYIPAHEPKVIGVPRAFLQSDGVTDYVLEDFEKGLDALREVGYEIKDIDLPHIALSLPVYYIVLPAEVSTNLSRYDGIRYGFSKTGKNLIDSYFETKAEGFGPEARRRILMGTYVLSAGYRDAYYTKATKVRTLITEELRQAFQEVDIIATPTSPTDAFKFGEKADPIAMYAADLFTVPSNITGTPAISIPTGKSPEDMPLSMQFMAPHFHDENLFIIGKKFEEAFAKKNS
ncbi:Asp-tRNA(Asn)/Glu-tRNA(Gln) amidotransferase subunit GatA [Candidatus Nomurabacteria bacterium]|nr:Asp-tRNA(Asn)/Glu-tRNA(Gln) amidotransferase subunit GatA [Candidatus Nomurabacteria bacterium]